MWHELSQKLHQKLLPKWLYQFTFPLQHFLRVLLSRPVSQTPDTYNQLPSQHFKSKVSKTECVLSTKTDSNHSLSPSQMTVILFFLLFRPKPWTSGLLFLTHPTSHPTGILNGFKFKIQPEYNHFPLSPKTYMLTIS